MSFGAYLAVIAVLDTLALVLARYYVDNGRTVILLSSMLSFFASGYVYVQLMAFGSTAVINLLYVAFSTVAVTFVFYFLFKERVSMGQGFGIVLIVLGISLLEL